MASVQVVALTKSFGDTHILKGITLDVPAGGFCVLVGPSGCGKSTLLRCLAGLEEPTSGQILLGGRDVTAAEPRDRDIAMVFQSYALYPHLSVRDNLAFGLKMRRTAPDEIARRVAKASSQLGLDPLLDRLPRQLSGGQRQRVAMGRAIVRQPQLFLFDEPLSNLDAALRSQVRVEIRKLHDELGATSVYVTHDQVEAMTLADVMVVLNRGNVEQAGPPLDIYRRPATRFVAGFLGSPSMSFLRGAVAADGSLRVGDVSLPAPPGLRAPAGTEVEVGVRAEEGRLDEASPWVMKAEVVEALGSETYVHGQGPGGALVLRLEPRSTVRRGDRLGVRFESVHVFAAEGGARLDEG
ncbi:MAG: sn-glycerol-3-phosphate ABC transporter ATP-binding protein UgpC [Myxococcales bacterium]|nr:MAG: sn-glycerol-3-phosphate ABC transporter ATP-binding protein UgpC [Myxococcales bacterium]